MKTVCFIGCVKSKLPTSAKARDIYISPLFRFSLAYALKNFDEVAILSSKYGLLDIDEVIETYEVTLNTMKKPEIIIWSNKVSEEIKKKYPDYKYYVIAGNKYHKYLSIEKEVLFKLSIGKKMQALKYALKEDKNGKENIN